jgi:hypothetical protein
MNDITISVSSDPFRTLIKSVIKDELQPTLYGNDNTLVGVIHEEIEASPRVQEHLKSVVIDTVLNSSQVEEFINDSLTTAADNSRSFRRCVEAAVEGCIDYGEIAANIEVREIADRISASDVASEICLDSLADGINYEKLAKALLREIRAEAAAAAKPTA